jgi:site-specific DNA recombinase
MRCRRRSSAASSTSTCASASAPSRSPAPSLTSRRPRRRAAGSRPSSSGYCRTRPTSGACTGADTATRASTSRSSTRRTFARARALLAERGEDVARRRGNASDFLLSGVLRCGHCKRAYVGMSAKGNGGTYHYYACSGRQKLGPRACTGERLSRDRLEQAVIAQLVSLYRDGELVRAALAKAVEESKQVRPKLDEQLGAVRAEIIKAERARAHYFDAFEAGTLSPTLCRERITALETRLADLRAQEEAELALSHDQEGERGLSEDDLKAVADRLETVITGGSPEKTKALLRLLIKELRVNGKSEILPTYRVVTPEVCATPSSVGGTGLEPVTPSLSSWCSPN